jgi:hypothetical protein
MRGGGGRGVWRGEKREENEKKGKANERQAGRGERSGTETGRKGGGTAKIGREKEWVGGGRDGGRSRPQGNERDRERIPSPLFIAVFTQVFCYLLDFLSQCCRISILYLNFLFLFLFSLKNHSFLFIECLQS